MQVPNITDEPVADEPWISEDPTAGRSTEAKEDTSVETSDFQATINIDAEELLFDDDVVAAMEAMEDSEPPAPVNAPSMPPPPIPPSSSIDDEADVDGESDATVVVMADDVEFIDSAPVPEMSPEEPADDDASPSISDTPESRSVETTPEANSSADENALEISLPDLPDEGIDVVDDPSESQTSFTLSSNVEEENAPDALATPTIERDDKVSESTDESETAASVTPSDTEPSEARRESTSMDTASPKPASKRLSGLLTGLNTKNTRSTSGPTKSWSTPGRKAWGHREDGGDTGKSGGWKVPPTATGTGMKKLNLKLKKKPLPSTDNGEKND